MFAGLMRLESSAISQHHCELMEGGKASATAGSSGRKRLHRRPGYMRAELPRLHSNATGETGEGTSPIVKKVESGCRSRPDHVDITMPTNALREHLPRAAGASSMDQRERVPQTHSSLSLQSFLSSLPSHLVENCTPVPSAKPQSDLRLNQGPATKPASVTLTSPGGNFSSRFSFIQQSLDSSQTPDETVPQAEPVDQSSPKHLITKPVSILKTELFPCDSLSTKASSQSTAAASSPRPPLAKPLTPNQSEATSAAASQPESEELLFGEKVWQEGQWRGTDVTSDLPDCDSCSLDTEVTSSLSVDSDTASASSVTSGYDSATPASDQGWDKVVKKYEGILQDFLQNNRTNAKIESMMLRLQRLQQKAILDDDYDTAERFGKKLEELCRERGALNLGLPSRQPSVALFLERLRKAVHSALQRTNYNPLREGSEPDVLELSDSAQGPQHRRERLIQEKRLVEAEIAELQRRLSELHDRSQSLEQQIQQEEQQVETEELEVSVLRSCTAPQLHDMSRALQDLITSENRTQISVTPSPSMLRLQEQEQVLNLSIKEATAKLVMSQRLSGSLRRKVSETETQLLALHEAKLAAVSGNDFGSAKELRAEIKAVCAERDRLEGLAKRLHALSSANGQELSRMKEQQRLLKQEVQQRGAQHESRLKENTTKYIELLEDRLHSCGCPALERVWEADLEACHLFLRGLQLHTPPGCSTADVDVTAAHSPPAARSLKAQPTSSCTKEEEDCAMLTALGGRWCPEADLQNSEFTKKLEEFLFCMEENHTEDECSDAGAVDLTEQCELISDRLIILEDELQTAMLNRDQDLTASLEKEVREVKATLQTMLAHLRVEEENEEDVDEVQDAELLEDGTEEDPVEEEEEEDQYFSDSWDI